MGWGEIDRVVAFMVDVYLGLVVCIAVEAADGTALFIVEGDAAYAGLAATLQRELPGFLPLEDWFFALTRDEIKMAVLFKRDDVNR